MISHVFVEYEIRSIKTGICINGIFWLWCNFVARLRAIVSKHAYLLIIELKY